MNIPTGPPPPNGASNARGMKKITIFDQYRALSDHLKRESIDVIYSCLGQSQTVNGQCSTTTTDHATTLTTYDADNLLSRFHLIPERYGQTVRLTDTQTDRIAISISRVSVPTRDKNNYY